jgi:hypothetical protein
MFQSPMELDITKHGSHYKAIHAVCDNFDNEIMPFTKIVALAKDLQRIKDEQADVIRELQNKHNVTR